MNRWLWLPDWYLRTNKQCELGPITWIVQFNHWIFLLEITLTFLTTHQMVGLNVISFLHRIWTVGGMTWNSFRLWIGQMDFTHLKIVLNRLYSSCMHTTHPRWCFQQSQCSLVFGFGSFYQSWKRKKMKKIQYTLKEQINKSWWTARWLLPFIWLV